MSLQIRAFVVCFFNVGILTNVIRRIYNTLAARLGSIWSYYLSSQSQAEKGLGPPLSSAPCSPAPGRRIIIIKNDTGPPRNNLFLTFDRVAPTNSAVQETSYANHGSMRGLLPNGSTPDPPPPKKRWNILKTMFTSPSNPRPGEVTPPGSSSEEAEQNPLDSSTGSDNNNKDKGSEDETISNNETQRPRTPHQPCSFRFSLEWLDRPQWPTKNRRLFPPPLPIPAQLVLQAQRARATENENSNSTTPNQDNGENKPNPDDEIRTVDSENKSKTTSTTATTTTSPPTSFPNTVSEEKASLTNPSQGQVSPPPLPPPLPPPELRDKSVVASKYAGRALAEWAMVVSECDNFFERRRDDGVPSNRLVEIPSLGVENFRNG